MLPRARGFPSRFSVSFVQQLNDFRARVEAHPFPQDGRRDRTLPSADAEQVFVRVVVQQRSASSAANCSTRFVSGERNSTT